MSKITEHIPHVFVAITLASEKIMRIYNRSYDKKIKQDGSPVTEADLSSSKIIAEELRKTGIPIIGEELQKAPYSQRKTWEKVWIVDPLDGTKEFIKGNGEFSVNIALVENDQPVFGIIASPVKQTAIFGGIDFGAFHCSLENLRSKVTWKELRAQPLNSPVIMIGSRSHTSGPVVSIIDHIKNKYGNIAHIKMGSSMKFFELVDGNADIYPRFAPTMEWDIAAGHAILNALDGKIVVADTENELKYNKEDLYNPHFVASTKAYLEDNA